MATPIPKNQAPFSAEELSLATSGKLLRAGARTHFSGVTTDSRAVSEGEIFVALRGEKFDGHEHAASAVERGAGALVLERDIEVGSQATIVRVSDGLHALAALARFHRQRWSRDEGARRLVGITGSAGKTTTRHVVEQLLSFAGARVHSSMGNLNNAIGVPMTLFGLTDAHDLAVVEMGMNQPGEIAHLARTALPDVGILTLVAEAHTGGVGSIEGVAHEKSELLAGLSPSGAAVVNGDDRFARAGLDRSKASRRIVYGECADADVRLVSRRPRGLAGSEVRIDVRRSDDTQSFELALPLLGRAGVYATLAAIATLSALEPAMPKERFAAVLARLPELPAGEAGRLAARELPNGTVVIDDAYNANPASMEASIEAAQEIARALERDLVLVLGPMFELGDESDALHERVGRRAAAAAPKRVVVVGSEPLAKAAAGGGAGVALVSDAAGAELATLDAVSPRDVVLVKASNSVGLSRVARCLQEKFR
ncbi:MAG: UDP-N-acetylmuramoyl-tripeptide--D-alanyl-D-alanine ligase [Myxococcales bacterium]|nr:UDP-N-acetylmuramoyl-tripeptide--D-alanyl-D-alanine ligase [Myxococcales bacterium]